MIFAVNSLRVNFPPKYILDFTKFHKNKNYTFQCRNNSTIVSGLVYILKTNWSLVTFFVWNDFANISTKSAYLHKKYQREITRLSCHVSKSSLSQQVRKVVDAIDGSCKQGDIRCRKSGTYMNKRQSNTVGKFGHAFTTHTTPRSGSLSLCSRHIYSTPCVVIRVPRVYEKRRSGQAGRLEEKAVSRTRRRNLGPDDQLTVVLFQMEILIVPLFSDVPLQLFRQ